MSGSVDITHRHINGHILYSAVVLLTTNTFFLSTFFVIFFFHILVVDNAQPSTAGAVRSLLVTLDNPSIPELVQIHRVITI